MGGKRRSMEARRRAGKARMAARQAKSGRELKPSSDGRYRIACPNCGTTYALPESALEQLLTCKNCKTRFTPKTAAKRGRGGQQNPLQKPLIFGGIVLVLVVAVFAFSGPSEKKPDDDANKEPEVAYLRTSSPQYRAAEKFANAVAAKSDISLLASLDLARHFDATRRGKTKVAYDYLPDDQKKEFVDELTQTLFEGEEGLVFREFEPWTVRRTELPPEESKKPFEFVMELAGRTEKKYADSATVQFWTVASQRGWQVLRWKVLSVPDRLKSNAEKKPKKERPEGVARPKLETIDVNGKKVRMEQSKPVPLGHLDGTEPGTQRKIDEAISMLMDPNAHFRKLNDARKTLVGIGKPSIPRLLNKFYETRGTSLEELEGLFQIAKTLEELSGGTSFGFRPNVEGANADIHKKMREKAMNGWYAWWYRNYHRKEFPPPIDPDEEIR